MHENDDSFQYSIDDNLWGRSISAGPLEDPDERPADSAFEITASVQDAPDEAAELDIEFKLGVPTSIDGEELSLADLIARLNRIAGRHGVGRIDHMEDRIIGLKSREVYEAPAAIVPLQAHRALESIVLTRPAIEFKRGVSHEFARLVYDGMWFTSHWMDLMTYIRSTQPADISVFVVFRWSGEPVNAAPEEHTEIRWFLANELPRTESADGHELVIQALTTAVRESTCREAAG